MLLTSDLPAWLVRGAAFMFGAVWGSFFNVAIYRWPREMSVVSPPSHCPSCGAPVPISRNVPILGYLFLRGRAACCGARLSPRYVFVELLTAVLCLALSERYVVNAASGTTLLDGSLWTLIYFAFIGGLIVATFVDLEWMEIPDEVSLPGAAFGLATAALRSEPGVEAAALGAGGGYLVVQILFVWSYERLMGRRGMGEGDSKLLMMIGAFVGWQGALFALVGGAMQGLLVAMFALVTGKDLTPTRPDELEADDSSRHADSPAEDSRLETEAEGESDPEPRQPVGTMKVPYGPFLALGALEFLFFGDWIVERYLSLFE